MHNGGGRAKDDVGDPYVVKTKGDSWRKNVKKNKKWSSCKNTGHTCTTCPLMKSVGDNSYAMKFDDSERVDNGTTDSKRVDNGTTDKGRLGNGTTID